MTFISTQSLKSCFHLSFFPLYFSLFLSCPFTFSYFFIHILIKPEHFAKSPLMPCVAIINIFKKILKQELSSHVLKLTISFRIQRALLKRLILARPCARRACGRPCGHTGSTITTTTTITNRTGLLATNKLARPRPRTEMGRLQYICHG